MSLFAFNAADRWSPVISVLVEAGLKSVVVLLFAAVAVALLRKSSAAVRHMVWFMAIASLPLLPLFSWVLPAWHILPASIPTTVSSPNTPSLLFPAAPQPASVPETAPKMLARAEEAREVYSPPKPSAGLQANTSPANHEFETEFSLTAPPPSKSNKAIAKARDPILKPYQWATMTWLGGCLLLLLPLLLGMGSLWWLSKTARQEDESEWLTLFRMLLEKLRLRRKVSLLKSSKRHMPMTWGVFRPKVLLPEESSRWPETRRQVVMLHELAHVKRWDYATNVISQMVCALYWFNPLVWLAAGLMVMERERACDDVVLQQGAQPADYAQQILDVAAALPKTRWNLSPEIPMARVSQLESRLRTILDGKRNRKTISKALVFAAFVLLSAGLVPVSMMKAQVSSGRRNLTQKDIANTNQHTTAAPGAEATKNLKRNTDFHRITGTVRDSQGSAVSNTIVSIRWLVESRLESRLDEKTDAAGHFQLTYVGTPFPSTKFIIMARSRERNLAVLNEYTVEATNFDLTLQQGMTLSGSVKDSLGGPIGTAYGNLLVEAGWGLPVELNPIRVDGNGEFVIQALPQGHNYEFINGISADGYGTLMAVVAATNTWTEHYVFPQFVLKKATNVLGGMVVGPDGAPLAGASVYYYGPAQQVSSKTHVTTDQMGHFFFTGVCDGEVQIYGHWHGPPGSGRSMSSGLDTRAMAGKTNVTVKFKENESYTKMPEETLDEIQRLLPAGWTSRLTKTGETGIKLWELKETPLYRIDLKNPDFSPFGGQFNLQLYFLTNSADNQVFLNSSPVPPYTSTRLFSINKERLVLLAQDKSGFFPYGLRSVAPVGRALQRYFGSPKDPEIASWIGLEGRPAGELIGPSGFQGQVVDDESGEPIRKFNLEFDPEPNRATKVPLKVWDMTLEFFGGRFALEGQGYPELKTNIPHDVDLDNLHLWIANTKVKGKVLAPGYRSEPLTPAPVVWPARVSNIVVRMKRTGVSEKPPVAASKGKTVDQVFSDLQRLLPEEWTCHLIDTTTVPGNDIDTAPGSPVRGIYFRNPNVSFRGELNLELYFLTTPEEKTRFFGHPNGSIHLFSDTPDFQVALYLNRPAMGSGLYLLRSIEPVSRIFKQYFGSPIDATLNAQLGLTGIVSGEFIGTSGFSGRVIDDDTGKPVKKFKLSFEPPLLGVSDGLLSESFPPVDYFDGRFTLEGKAFSGTDIDNNTKWNGSALWPSNTIVKGSVLADGYVSTPLLPEPILWPVKVTNILIRLKKMSANDSKVRSIPVPQDSKDLEKSKTPTETVGWMSSIHGRLVDGATDETIRQYWIQHGLVTRTGATNWSEYYESPANIGSSAFSLPRVSLDQVWRIMTIAHEPFVVTSQQFDTNWSNFVVRLKPVQQLRGTVVDHRGQPVQGAYISVTNVETRLDLVSGLAIALGCNSTTTDAQGNFILPRPSGMKMKIIAISADRQMIQPALIPEDGRDVRITFPQPAILSMIYDVPGDTALPSMGMALATFEKDASLWKGIKYIVTSPLTNGSKTILSNLTPGRYNFVRGLRSQMPNNPQGVGMGLDDDSLTLEAGKVGVKNMIRTNGFRIRGIVSGLEKAGVEKGRIRVGGGSLGNITVDALYFGRDGRFQTVMLPPGKYRVDAAAMPPAVEQTKPESSGAIGTPIGFSAGMVVTLTGTEPEEVKLDLLLSTDPANEAKREEIRREMSTTNIIR